MRKRFWIGFGVLIAAGLSYPLLETPISERRQNAILQRVQDFMARHRDEKAVALVGDSLVESATFSPTICGRPVINAGYAGAVASGVLELIEKLDRVRFSPAIMVISVGVNNSMFADRRPFAETYQEIVRKAVASGGKVFLVSLAPVAASGSLADHVDRSRFWDIDQLIRQTARDHAIPLIDVGALHTQSNPQVADGIHLSADGYAAWTGTIEDTVNRQCP